MIFDRNNEAIDKQSTNMVHSYISLNPDCLEEYSYRDLQKLCKSLRIKASGKRDQLIGRLKIWHKSGRSWEKAQCGKFHLLGVRVSSPDQHLLSPLKWYVRRLEERGSPSLSIYLSLPVSRLDIDNVRRSIVL